MGSFAKWLIAIVVVGFLVLFGGFMIGSAVYDSKKQEVELSIQCMKAGGNPVINNDRNGRGFECRKA